MTTRYGTVIKFKAGTTKAQAERFIQMMATEVGTIVEDPRTPSFRSGGYLFPAHSGVNEYDDYAGEDGEPRCGPVWYVP